MKKYLIILLVCMSLSISGYAQNTTVTATVVDGDSVAWANALWTIDFVPGLQFPSPGQYSINGAALSKTVTHQTGTLNGSGALSVVVYDSSIVNPTGSGWRLNICPLSSGSCVTYQFATAGASQSISANLTSLIGQPRFSCSLVCNGYNTIEATGMNTGSMFYNTTSNSCSQWNGSSWTSCGNGGFPDGTAQATAAYSTQGVTVSTACTTASIASGTCFQLFADGQVSNVGTSNSTTTVTCANCNFTSADVGKLFWASTNAKAGLYETVVCPQTTIASVTNSTTAILNATCTANASANAIFVWGHDDGTTLNSSMFQDCRSVKIGAGSSTFIITSKGFANTSLSCNNSVLTGVLGAPRASLIGDGYLASQTTFIMTPNFSWSTCTGTADAEGNTFCFFRQLRSVANVQIWGSGLTPAANTNCANASGKAVAGVSGSGNMGGVDIAGICAGQSNLEGIVVAGQDNTLSEGGAQDVGQWACVFSQYDGESGFGNDCHNLDPGAGNYGLRITGGAKVFQYANTPIAATLIDGNSTLTSMRTTYTAPSGTSQAVSNTSGSTFISYNDNISGNGNTGLLNAGTAYMSATPHAGTPPLSNSGTLFTTMSTYTGSPNITAGTVSSGGGNTFTGGTITVSSGATHYGSYDTFNAVTVNSGGKLNISNTSITGTFTNNGSVISGGGNKLSAIPSGTGSWLGGGVLVGTSRGTCTSSATLGLFGLGQYTTSQCTNTTTTAGVIVQQVPLSGSVFGLVCTATHAGVNASSGVVTLLKNGSATTLTCTIGTGTSCSDFSHFDVPAIGDVYSAQVTTQATEVLAGVYCTALNF